ncbi:MAG: uroporphyrinogen decarboxylase family protein, partial [Spirochaetota bacterium]
DHLRRLWAPRTERLVAAAKGLGKPVLFHCCGCQEPILPYLVDWDVDAVHPIQPGANDIYAMKRKYGTNLALVGNVDVAKELSYGSEEDTRRSVREHVDLLADGAYVLCSSHSIIDSVIPGNYLAMCDEVQKYGRY